MDEIHVFSVAMTAILIPITAIIGAFVFVIVKTLANARVRELEIKERIARIDHGLVPPPEVDPGGFERAMSRERVYNGGWGASRRRSAGIMLLGIGFGLMVLIAAAGSPREGIGVGGFLVILGVAFFINSRFERHQAPPGIPRGNEAGSASAPTRTSDTRPPS